MSANNAKSSGEVTSELDAIEKSPNFESPNFESVTDEEQKKKDKAAAERKKAETVDIDGIPIDEKELKFKAADIKKKGKTEYFVNVEGAEERKRNEEKRIRDEALEAKREAEEKAREAEEKARAAQAAANKKAAEAKKRATAEDNRVINELKQKAAARKKEIRRAKCQARRKRITSLLFEGGHKFITAGIVLLTAAVVIWFIVVPIEDARYAKLRAEQQAKEEEEIMKQLENDEDYVISTLLDSADEDFRSFNLQKVDEIYDKALSMASNDGLKAEIYLRKSQTTYDLMYDLEPERVLNDALAAYRLVPDSPMTIDWLITVYDRRGDKKKVEEFEKKRDALEAQWQTTIEGDDMEGEG